MIRSRSSNVSHRLSASRRRRRAARYTSGRHSLPSDEAFNCSANLPMNPSSCTHTQWKTSKRSPVARLTLQVSSPRQVTSCGACSMTRLNCGANCGSTSANASRRNPCHRSSSSGVRFSGRRNIVPRPRRSSLPAAVFTMNPSRRSSLRRCGLCQNTENRRWVRPCDDRTVGHADFPFRRAVAAPARRRRRRSSSCPGLE